MMFPEGESTAPEIPEPPAEKSAILKYVLLAAGALYVIASLYLMYDMRTGIMTLEQKETGAGNGAGRSGQAPSRDVVGIQARSDPQAGMTKQELAQRAAELERQQKAAAAKLAAEQSQQSQATGRSERRSQRA